MMAHKATNTRRVQDVLLSWEKVGPGLLTIGAGSDESSLLLTVEDDGLGASVPLRPGLGIGNTRERLEAIYGERAALSVDTSPHGGFCATIQIPLPEERT